jgi:hypothetical protein
VPAYLDRRGMRWRFRATVTLANGTKHRLLGTPAINSKAAAEAALRERVAIMSGYVAPAGAPRGAADVREIVVTLRATHAEAASWHAMADAEGVTFSDWMRARLDGKRTRRAR